MDVLSETEAKKIITNAQMICSLDHGYIVNVSKDNPYKNIPFDIPHNSVCWIEEHDLGKILKIEVEKKVKLVAFLLSK